MNWFTGQGYTNDFAAVPIWFGKGANHCLVIGDPTRTGVLDQGTDDILINVNPLPLPPDPALSPAPNTATKVFPSGVR